MANPQKVQVVQEVTEHFTNSSAAYFADYKGMNVDLMNQLRSEFYKADIEFKVYKKTLTKLAAKNAGFDNIDELIDGQMAVAFAKEDAVLPARLVRDFVKENKVKHFKLTGCILEGQYFGSDQVGSLADLPSRDELIAKLARTLSAPMSNMVGVLSASMRDVVGVLNSLKDKKDN